MKNIRLGHTPDADDAFMFYGIASGHVSSSKFTIEHTIEDIETLNKRALNHELDITAISAHTYGYLRNHVILLSGGSFGINYGPIVISKKNITLNELKESKIAIPGKMTSASLLLNLAVGNFNGVEMRFDLIPDAVLSDSVDAGLVIHETQISYGQQFQMILDLGKWWNTFSNGLPVPLGINVASRRSLTIEEIIDFDHLFRESIKYGLEHFDDALNYSMQYGRGHEKELIGKFIKMYVNNLTISMGNNGKDSIILLLNEARSRGILSHDEIVFAVK